MILNTTDEILGALEKGNLSKDFAQALREVLTACQEHEGKGTVTLKLKVAAKDDVVTVKGAIDSVVPKKERRSTTLFLTREGQLSMQHPDQIDMRFESRRREAIDAD